MDDRIYFPVENIGFKDLYDWSRSRDKAPVVRTGRVRRLVRADSQTGAAVTVNMATVALFRHGDKVYAMDEKCPHAGGPLHLGDIESLPGQQSLCVRCPWHGWCFDVNTGKVRRPVGRNLSANIYKTKVRDDGTILVGFTQFHPHYFVADDF